MSADFDPRFDLRISRVIRAPRAMVWRAWADPRRFERWWVPAPALCKVVRMDLRPGGAFETQINENGSGFTPHMNACFVAVEDQHRLIFTDTLHGGWRPAEGGFLTAVISLADHPDGTDYRAHAMHKSGADRDRHEEMGFFDGWGTVISQLATQVEREVH